MQRSAYESDAYYYAQSICLGNISLGEKLDEATESWLLLQNESGSAAALCFLEVLAKLSSCVTLLLLFRLQKNNYISENDLQSLRSMISKRCVSMLEKLEAEPFDDKAERSVYVKQLLQKEAKHIAPPMPKNFRKLSKITAAAMLLGDDDITAKAVLLAKEMAESYTDLPEDDFTDEEKEDIGKYIPNRPAMCFAAKTLEPLLLSDDPQERSARLYMECYKSFPMSWNENIAYNAYGANFNPPAPQPPASLVKLVHQAVEDHELRYIYLMIKIFNQTDPAKFGYSIPGFMELAFTAPDKLNLFRGLLLAEKFCLNDAVSETDGLERWWTALSAAVPEESAAWRENESWFRMYYLCRRINACPERASEYLYSAEPLPPCDSIYKKSYVVQQTAMEKLLTAPDQSILKLIDVLGENNVFRFNSYETMPPYINLHLRSKTPEQLVDGLLKQRFTEDQLIFIYMNTNLRSQIALDRFMGMIVRSKMDIGHKEEKSGITVSGIFKPYTMRGEIKQILDNKFGLVPHHFSFQPGRLLALIQYWDQQADFCRSMMESEKTLDYHIVSFSLINNTLYVSLDKQDWMEEWGEQGFNAMCSEFREIAQKGTFDEDDNQRIQSLPLPSLADPDRIDTRALGLLMVQCCAALSYRYLTVRYFLNLMNKKYNPFKYQVPKYFKKNDRYFRSDHDRLSDEQLAFLDEQWERIINSGLTKEQTFFIYVNTILRLSVPLSFWAERYTDGKERLELTELMKYPTQYIFGGTVKRIDHDPECERGCILTIAPDDLYRGADRYICRSPQDPRDFWNGQRVNFGIGSYIPERRTFMLDHMMTLSGEESSSGLNKRFSDALNRAAKYTDLSQRELDALKIPMGTIHPVTTTAVAQEIATALRLRQHDLPEINRYMSALGPNNLWRFDKPLPQMKKHIPRNVLFSMQNTWRILAEKDVLLSGLLQFYFNSPMRSCLKLNTAVNILLESGRDIVELSEYMKDYRLIVRCRDNAMKPVNFTAGDIYVSGLPPLSGKDDDPSFVCLLEGYDPDTDTLYLHYQQSINAKTPLKLH